MKKTARKTSAKKVAIQSLNSKGSFSPEIPCQASWDIQIAGGIQFAALPTAQPDPVQGASLTVMLPNPRNTQGSDAMICMWADITTHKLYIYKVAGPTPPA